MIKKIFTIIWRLIYPLKAWWFNFTYQNDLNDLELAEEDTIKEKTFITDLRKLLNKVYTVFEYTLDGPTVLFDAIHKPAQSYLNYRADNFEDDCDGFAACIYHILYKHGYSPVLFTYIASKLSESHTIVYVERNGKYYVIDYTKIYTGATLEECLEDLYEDREVEVLATSKLIFDYDKNKYKVTR